MTLAAVLATAEVGHVISQGEPGVFMHGPTFMGNPLACSVAVRSIELLLESDWQTNISRIETELKNGLEPCRSLTGVKDVRVLGAIGVVELDQPVNMARIQKRFVDNGVWVRPFGRLVYIMPPYIISNQDLRFLTKTICRVVEAELSSMSTSYENNFAKVACRRATTESLNLLQVATVAALSIVTGKCSILPQTIIWGWRVTKVCIKNFTVPWRMKICWITLVLDPHLHAF